MSSPVAVLSRSHSLYAILQEAAMREEGGGQVNRAVQVVIGVDTHRDEHVAVAIDQQGGSSRPTPFAGDYLGIWGSGAMVPELGRG